MGNVDYQALSLGVITGLRIVRIEARRSTDNVARSGKLDMTAAAKMQILPGRNVTLTDVTIELSGGVEGDSHREPAFSISVTAQAEMKWPPTLDEKVFGLDEVLHLLARSPYLLCVSEARQLAHKLGLGSVNVPPDFVTAMQLGAAQEKKADGERVPSEKPPKRVRARKQSVAK